MSFASSNSHHSSTSLSITSVWYFFTIQTWFQSLENLNSIFHLSYHPVFLVGSMSMYLRRESSKCENLRLVYFPEPSF